MIPDEQMAAIPVDRDELLRVLQVWGNPPKDLIDKLPKPTKRTNEKGKCRECGGWHGLPAVHLDYMGHASVTRALIEVDPRWSWEPVAFNEQGEPLVVNAGGHLRLWGRLTVLGVTRICVGTCDAAKPEPEKELIGDLLRNGAMRFGIGLGLWAKDEWGDLGEVGGGGRDATTVPVGSVEEPSEAAAPVSRETWEAVKHRVQVELDEFQAEALKAWAHEQGWKVTQRSLTEEQALEVLGWVPPEIPGQQTLGGGEVTG